MRHRLAFFAITILLAGIAAAMPFTIASLVDDVMGTRGSDSFPIPRAPAGQNSPTFTRLQVDLVSLDPLGGLITLRLSGLHACNVPCLYSDQVVFFSLLPDRGEFKRIQPSATIQVKRSDVYTNHTLQLPIAGNPLRFPFDDYRLVLGVLLQRVYPDGRVQTLTPAESEGHLKLSVQARLPRERMRPPVPLDPARMRQPGDPNQYLYVEDLRLERPRYLKILAVLLVLLIGVTAACVVAMQPFGDLVLNAGGLVLGVWGIRQILEPDTAYLTIVDLALSAVILFLLLAIPVRAVLHVHPRSGVRLPWQAKAGGGRGGSHTPR